MSQTILLFGPPLLRQNFTKYRLKIFLIMWCILKDIVTKFSSIYIICKVVFKTLEKRHFPEFSTFLYILLAAFSLFSFFAPGALASAVIVCETSILWYINILILIHSVTIVKCTKKN